MKNLALFLFTFMVTGLFSQNTYKELFYETDELVGINELHTADLDGDTDLDFVLISHNGKKIYVSLMDSLTPPSYNLINDDADVRLVILQDFNNDGNIDIIGSAPFIEKSFWWENDGSGNFTKHELSFGDYDSIVFGDFDGDNKDEIVVGHKNGIRIYTLNDGEADLKKIVFNDSWIGSADALSTVDNNGDGLLDIIACFDLNGIKIFENKGGFEFKTINVEPKVYNMEKVRTSDFNKDGLIDIVVFSSFNAKTEVLIKKHDGTYDKKTMEAGSYGNDYSDFGDCDGDGDMDILYMEKTSYFEGNISILKNNEGVFDKELISTEYPSSIGEIADFDNDGDNDLCLFTNSSFHKGILIYKNTTPPSSILYNKLEEKVNIYPSICTSSIMISSENQFPFKIVDVYGRLITKGTLIGQNIVDCSNWRNGTYFIIINKGKNTITKRVIKINK